MKNRVADLQPTVEFALVVGLAFGPFIASSLYHLFFMYGEPAITASQLRRLIIHEIVVSAAIGWFLRERNWSAVRLGAVPSASDVPVGIGLAIAAYTAFFAVSMIGAFTVPALLASGRAGDLVGGTLDLPTVLVASVVNPVFEETLVCGYVMTSLKSATTPATAVSVSAAIRLLYHLYQGPLAAFGVLPVGLVFTWWYAHTRRLWPIVIAHAILDFIGLARSI